MLFITRKPFASILWSVLLLLFVGQHPGSSFALGMSAADSAASSGTGSTCPESGGLVIVTGGSQGIGRATSLLLASRGYNVAIADVKPAESVVQEIETLGSKGKAVAFVADISKEEQVSKLFRDVHASFGMDPMGLVNNAGIMEKMERDIVNIDKATLDADLAVNTYGPFFCCKEFVRRTSTKRGGKGGAIVNVSSVSAESGQPLAYAMSKGAQESMLAGLSKSLPLEGIRINTIRPGLTDTPMAPEGQVERLAEYIPMRRAGNPEEVAKGIAYLLSEGTYCSGAILRIAGGL